MSAFVDASAFYTLLVRTESRHAELLQAFRQALEATGSSRLIRAGS